MYTACSAAVVIQEVQRGAIEAGKDADFTVIDRDILEVAPEQIPATKVLKAIVAGKVVYEA